MYLERMGPAQAIRAAPVFLLLVGPTALRDDHGAGGPCLEPWWGPCRPWVFDAVIGWHLGLCLWHRFCGYVVAAVSCLSVCPMQGAAPYDK